MNFLLFWGIILCRYLVPPQTVHCNLLIFSDFWLVCVYLAAFPRRWPGPYDTTAMSQAKANINNVNLFPLLACKLKYNIINLGKIKHKLTHPYTCCISLNENLVRNEKNAKNSFLKKILLNWLYLAQWELMWPENGIHSFLSVFAGIWAHKKINPKLCGIVMSSCDWFSTWYFASLLD